VTANFVPGKLYRVTTDVYRSAAPLDALNRLLCDGDVALFIERKAHVHPYTRSEGQRVDRHWDYVFLNKDGETVTMCWNETRDLHDIFVGPL